MARVEGESTAGISTACEYAETEAAALPGGADKAARCMDTAETGENPASACSTASIPAAREYAERAEAAALPGGADRAARCMGAAKTGENPASARSAEGVSTACEYAETAEAAALPGGADKAAHRMGAAETGENPASGIPISGETELKRGEAVQSHAGATPEAQRQRAAQPEGCAGNEDSTGTLIADEAVLECSETRETTQSRACAAERAMSEAARLHVTLPRPFPSTDRQAAPRPKDCRPLPPGRPSFGGALRRGCGRCVRTSRWFPTFAPCCARAGPRRWCGTFCLSRRRGPAESRRG